MLRNLKDKRKLEKLKKKKGKESAHWCFGEPRFKIDSVGFCTDHHSAVRKWLENTYISFGTLKSRTPTQRHNCSINVFAFGFNYF